MCPITDIDIITNGSSSNTSHGKPNILRYQHQQDIHQFQVGYIWLPFMKSQKILRDKVNKMMTGSFKEETTTYTKNAYGETNTHILVLMTFYGQKKPSSINYWGG